ncbi:histidine phosphatase family protein [Paenarthrobacter sp. NCHU4564]|uniref:histidine phosphatase family protein n=1 Tax=Paenarthrobacter sp. NCHU4564 TaxID=3451353 RepID=UPI003F950497
MQSARQTTTCRRTNERRDPARTLLPGSYEANPCCFSRLMAEARTIAFVRHGQTDWNAQRRIQGLTDVPLNQTGQQQATQLGLKFASGDWHTIISSPLSRAKETAALLAKAAGIRTTTIFPALTERSYGLAEGLPVAEANAQWPDGAFPCGESLSEVTDRGLEAVHAVILEHPGNLILVSHGGVLRSTLAALTGVPWPRVLNGTRVLLQTCTDCKRWWQSGNPSSARSRQNSCCSRNGGT